MKLFRWFGWGAAKAIAVAAAVCLLPVSSAVAQAQGGEVQGNVFTDQGQPLPRVPVVVKGTELKAVTDDAGRFSITGVPSGQQAVVVALKGFRTETLKVTVTPDKPATADFILASDLMGSEEIVVTGTSLARAAFNTPLAVQTRDATDLARLGTSSQADILNSVPTIKAEAGGGEVATNVFIRGLPSGGQYQFTPLMYDGIPVLSSFGLNSSAYDVYYRNDLGIERLEFVRGGVSNLFGPGSVAGLINYISRTGDEETTGAAQLEWAERGRYRGDVAVSGPLAGAFFYAFSGFYRFDQGPIHTDLDTQGFQARGNLRARFPDDSGHVTLYGQYIDDKVQFYLPVPLEGDTRHRARGNDGRRVFSVQNANVAGLGFNRPDGRFTTDIEDGVVTRGGSVALAFEKKFGGGWGTNGRTHYGNYGHRFGLWSDGDGVVNVPETLSSFVTNPLRRAPAVIPELNGITLDNATFTFADGSAVPADYLLFANRFTDRDRPMHDFTAELNLTKEFKTGPANHKVTLGGFYGDAVANDFNVTTTYLAEFNNQPRLVNLVVTNPTTGAQSVISQDGLLNAGAGFTNNRHRAQRYPIYIADQIEADRWAFDVGLRLERMNGHIRRERTATVTTDANSTLSKALREVIWGNGVFQTYTVSVTEWALAAGALFRVTDELNVYANASRGYFFPELRSITINSTTGDPLPQSDVAASYKGEIIQQAEIGVKYSSDAFSASLAGLYTRLINRRQVNFINDPNNPGGFIDQVNLVGTRSYGVEATLGLRLVGRLFLEWNLTRQEHEYTEFRQTPANVGKELERQPNILYNLGLFYRDYERRIDASLFTNYTGDDFTAANNSILLAGFDVVNFDAGYRIPVNNNSSFRLGINVFNVFDTDATTEGSPRQDVNQTTGGAYFVARPVLPRRLTARATFNF